MLSKWPQKNISIKQIELRGLEAEIDKNDAKGNFLPSINAQANHSLEYWIKPRYYKGDT